MDNLSLHNSPNARSAFCIAFLLFGIKVGICDVDLWPGELSWGQCACWCSTRHSVIIQVLRNISHPLMKLCFYFRVIRGVKKYYIYFVYNLLPFPTVKEFSKSVNIWWSYCKNFDGTFFETQCIFSCRKSGLSWTLSAFKRTWHSNSSCHVFPRMPKGARDGGGGKSAEMVADVAEILRGWNMNCVFTAKTLIK